MAQDQILSMCTGIGGLDLGLSSGLRAIGRNPRTVCMVEGEAYAVSVLARQMREGWLDECPLWLGDLSHLPLDQLPAIDWITAGYPCPPFSSAGKRLGEEDPRHLWPRISEIMRSVRPGGVFFENVSGHLSIGLDSVLRDMAGLGYSSAFGLFSAEEVGAPHRRERVFILGIDDEARDRGFCDRLREEPERSDPGVCSRSGSLVIECEECTQSDLAHREIDTSDADSDSGGLQEFSKSDSQPEYRYAQRRDNLGRFCADVSNPLKCPREPSRPVGRVGGGGQPVSWDPDRPWCSEPGICRVDDGVPSRVDRLRALGNAVVPHTARAAFLTLWGELG